MKIIIEIETTDNTVIGDVQTFLDELAFQYGEYDPDYSATYQIKKD